MAKNRKRPNVATPQRNPSRAMAMLERLEHGHFFEVMRWPTAADDATDATFAMCALSDDELQYAFAAAHVRLQDVGIPITAINAQELHDETNTQILARAMRVVGTDGEPADETWFADADELRGALRGPARAKVRNLLTDAYLRVSDEADPELTPELSEQVIELAKKKAVGRLLGYASSTLVGVLIGLVADSET